MRHLREAEVAAWVEETLLSPGRTRPIVAVTSHAGTDRGWIEPEALQRELGDQAEVVFLETGDPTWALADALPPLLDVYGGAVRVWWPGLTRQSDPCDHRLYFVRGMADAARVERAIVDAVAARSGAAPGTAPPGTAPPPPAPLGPERVRVTGLGRDEVVVASDARRGVLQEADLPNAMLVDLLQIGCELEARPTRQLPDGRWAFSSVGLLPDPWRRFADDVKKGDVVVGRVQNLHEVKKLVFVDVLPGVVGVCHVKELDYVFVELLADFVQPGELLAFEVLEFDAAARSLQLSRKRAFTATPRPLPPLFAGGRPFVWKPGMPWFGNLRAPRTGREAARPLAMRAGPAPTAPRAEAPDLAERVDELQQQLEAAAAERHSQVAQIRQLRQQLQDAKRELRSSDDRLQAALRSVASEDPLASERAFLQAVRLDYARRFDEGDRLDHPLQRMRVGRQFLASVRAVDGIEVDKVVEVCAEVAAGIAHTKAGRDVHPLRAGSRGADSRTRQRDGAKAWRCALQVNSPSARRLHWWNVPGTEPRIEFACVGVHDDFDIPEE